MFNIRQDNGKGGSVEGKGKENPEEDTQSKTRPDSYANFQLYLYTKRRIKPPRHNDETGEYLVTPNSLWKVFYNFYLRKCNKSRCQANKYEP